MQPMKNLDPFAFLAAWQRARLRALRVSARARAEAIRILEIASSYDDVYSSLAWIASWIGASERASWLAYQTRAAVDAATNRMLAKCSYRERCAEAAQLLREGWAGEPLRRLRRRSSPPRLDPFAFLAAWQRARLRALRRTRPRKPRRKPAPSFPPFGWWRHL